MADRTYGLFRNDVNKRLIARLEEQNANVLLFPEIICSPVNTGQGPDLSEFDWIVFPDLYSVDFFLASIRQKFALDELKVCALGESVSDRLRFSQIHADVIPSENNAKTVFSSLAEYQTLAGTSFLIPAEADCIPGFSLLLKESGAKVKELPVYKINGIPDLPRLRTLLRGGAVDEFIFTSPQDVFSFARFTGSEKAPEKIDVKASATDEITFQTLRESGLSPVIYK